MFAFNSNARAIDKSRLRVDLCRARKLIQRVCYEKKQRKDRIESSPSLLWEICVLVQQTFISQKRGRNNYTFPPFTFSSFFSPSFHPLTRITQNGRLGRNSEIG